MANILKTEKKVAVISMLAEGSSIRAIERITGVNRNTIMSLGLRVGAACKRIMDEKMRGLTCKRIEIDEIWGFIGTKRKNATRAGAYGDVWTFIALDADTKLIPSFIIGKRDMYHARAFMEDLAGRLSRREAERTVITGMPNVNRITTSHVEKQNHTLRMHCRRLTRLTNAFSKKLENFEAAVALNFAYYNFCKTHGALRMTPAMAAGIESSHWTVAELVERCGE